MWYRCCPRSSTLARDGNRKRIDELAARAPPVSEGRVKLEIDRGTIVRDLRARRLPFGKKSLAASGLYAAGCTSSGCSRTRDSMTESTTKR